MGDTVFMWCGAAVILFLNSSLSLSVAALTLSAWLLCLQFYNEQKTAIIRANILE